MLITGVTEGGGLFLLALPFTGTVAPWPLIAFGALVIVRFLVWHAYRRRLGAGLARGAASALAAPAGCCGWRARRCRSRWSR